MVCYKDTELKIIILNNLVNLIIVAIICIVWVTILARIFKWKRNDFFLHVVLSLCWYTPVYCLILYITNQSWITASLLSYPLYLLPLYVIRPDIVLGNFRKIQQHFRSKK